MTKTAFLVLWAALCIATPAAAQFILSEHPSYPSGVGDQFPPGATSVSGAQFYSFQIRNLTGVPQAISQITLSLATTGIAPADISGVTLTPHVCCFSASGTVVGDTIVFAGLAGHIVPGAGGVLRYVATWNVANLVPGDRAEVDIATTGLIPNATSGDAAPVVHLAELAIPALGVVARLALAVGICVVTAALARRIRVHTV